MAIYYIDSTSDCAENDGLSPKRPVSALSALSLVAGDTVLFKRGTRYAHRLVGEKGVHYGAYGEGEKPIFDLSDDLSAPECWELTDTPNVWRCTVPVFGEVGNFIFNDNECTATFRWTKEDLSGQGDFWDNRYVRGNEELPTELLLYSIEHPARVYQKITAACYAYRSIALAAEGNTFDGLRFQNSGVHGLVGHCDHVTVRNCDFVNIGGGAFSTELRVRFGNALEFWTNGNHILVENCYFKNIYDSCVTHQGPGEATIPSTRFICRNNVFDTYGMAAFEYRDKMMIDSEFTGNLCLNAGCGFAMLGEGEVRLSEIYPEPMGHHIFLWRIEHQTEGGSLLIADNTFGYAPAGAAIYARISPEAEAQMTIRNNRYTPNDRLLFRFGGENYSSLEAYQSKTGQDIGSCYVDKR